LFRRKTNGEFTLKTLFVQLLRLGFAYNIYGDLFRSLLWWDEVHLSGKLAGLIWSLFGWTCLASGLVWGSYRIGWGERRPFLETIS